MRYLLLFLFFCLIWFVVFCEGLAEKAYKAKLQGKTAGGSSLIPIIPVVPLLLAWASHWIDRRWPFKGTWGLGLLHLGLGAYHLRRLLVFQKKLTLLEQQSEDAP
jgi:hypothetical protein